ncbi:MAG: thioesterase [Actinomycetota bacterium]|nr:thioesterase [Actinomycetota bacterium]
MLEPGLQGTVERTVTKDMTATALGSGDVPVLGTPAVVALVEAAACRAVQGRLGDGEISVGTRIELSHDAAVPVGTTVTAAAHLVEVDGRRLTFEVRVSEPSGDVATGRHVRVVVQRRKFLEKIGATGQPAG